MAIASWTGPRRALARWLPRRLQGWLLLTHVTLVVLSLGGLGAWTGLRLRTATLTAAEDQLRLQADLVADALREPLLAASRGQVPDDPSLASLTAEYARSTGTRVTVLDPQLRALVSSDGRVPPAGVEREPELLAAREGRDRPAVRRDGWRGDRRLFVAVPVASQGRAVGYVQCSVPMAPIDAEIARHWLGLLAVGAGILGAAVLVSVALARQIAGPVQRLTDSTEEIAAGRTERRVTPAGPEEIRRLGQAFNRMAGRVQELLGRQQAFVANAAHELRSPLTGLRLRLELLQAGGRGDDELARRYLGQMAREVAHLQRLVDALLALSALDEGQAGGRAALDPAPLLYDLAEELSPRAREAGLDLRVDVPPHLPTLLADAEQLRMLVRNLLDNAVKYTPAGGAIALSAAADDGAVAIAVADTGVGIPPEALPRLYDRFYRVDKARSRRQGGAGLGLALVRAIAQAHGGCVETRSRPGGGSTFVVRLPVCRSPAEGGAGRPAGPGS